MPQVLELMVLEGVDGENWMIRKKIFLLRIPPCSFVRIIQTSFSARQLEDALRSSEMRAERQATQLAQAMEVLEVRSLELKDTSLTPRKALAQKIQKNKDHQTSVITGTHRTIWDLFYHIWSICLCYTNQYEHIYIYIYIFCIKGCQGSTKNGGKSQIQDLIDQRAADNLAKLEVGQPFFNFISVDWHCLMHPGKSLIWDPKSWRS